MPTDRLARFAWFVVAYNIAVVLYGAVVRATGSGAGCGSNWPDCNGGALPLTGTTEELIEFGHRASSGLALILVAVLVIGVLRSRPSGDRTRSSALASGVLILAEAGFGAMLVLFEWTGDDQSTGRAVSISLHLVLTFGLLAALTLTAWWLGGGRSPNRPLDRRDRNLFSLAIGGLLLVGAAGAITALGDTLFPAESLLDGIRDDFTGAFLVRLRWIHPVVAVAVSALVVYLTQIRRPAGGPGRRLADGVAVLIAIQLVAGVVNVILLAPVWMQVVHLLLADLLWIGFVLFTVETLAEPVREPVRQPVAP